MFGFGKLFFGDAWNWVDVVIVVSSLGDAISSAVGGGDSSGLAVIRLLRVLRHHRLGMHDVHMKS